MDTVLIKKFKFSANLEFVHDYLTNKGIPHTVNFETNSLFCNAVDSDAVLKIVEEINLDENDVEVDDLLLKGYDEWIENMYNPGYYMGGRTPSFNNNTQHYLVYGLISFASGLACTVETLYSDQFSKLGFWIGILITLLVSGSMFYQYHKFIKNKKN